MANAKQSDEESELGLCFSIKDSSSPPTSVTLSEKPTVPNLNILPLQESENNVSAGPPNVSLLNQSTQMEFTDQQKAKHLKLRDYQLEVAKRSLGGENDVIILPTGTGKTYVAIHIILEHLEKRQGSRSKIIFFVPTTTLASQQMEKIKDHLPLNHKEKCRKITGDDNMPPEWVKELIKENDCLILVVTPAIIKNYFLASEVATIYDFTLLIFDECHHAKANHDYNRVLCLYHKTLQEKKTVPNTDMTKLPQLVGMTASVGIGDAKGSEKARQFMIEIFARFCLKLPPSKVNNLKNLFSSTNDASEEYKIVPRCRKDRFTECIEHLMTQLEKIVSEKVNSETFCEVLGQSSRLILSETDKSDQAYEQYWTNIKNELGSYLENPLLKKHVNVVIIAIEHLLVYYKTLQITSLLNCTEGMKFLKDEMNKRPELATISKIAELYSDTKEKLSRLMMDVDLNTGNEKLKKLTQVLEDGFHSKPDSKVIILVQTRVVAKYLAALLNVSHSDFKAKEFTSPNASVQDQGMSLNELQEARRGFEDDKYNILVSTSVVEEGTDIQACNMLIKYMYAKDVIGTVQARGRVRDKGGKIIIIVDRKLLDQEMKNKFKENIMNETLKEIQDLTPEQFLIEIQACKNTLFSKVEQRASARGLETSGKIICGFCGAFLGDVCDMRQYLESHHLLLDGELHTRVKPYPDAQEMKPLDGMVEYGFLKCIGENAEQKHCEKRIGTLVTMKATGSHFGVLKIKSIMVDGKRFAKYQKLKEKYRVKSIQVEELNLIADKTQFKMPVLGALTLTPDGAYSTPSTVSWPLKLQITLISSYHRKTFDLGN